MDTIDLYVTWRCDNEVRMATLQNPSVEVSGDSNSGCNDQRVYMNIK